MECKSIDMNKWIEENKNYFLPPICNKMMHNCQLKVFFVGGPNQRKDYHIEEGEELFYMIKGDMCLKVIEKGKPKDVIIREGQVFLLAAKIPHSPQRFTNTIGLVIERERLREEWDALRYLVEGTTDILYERWFYCQDLGSQLVPIIQEFQSTEEYKTGKPSENSILRPAPYSDDKTQELMTPFSLNEWLETNAKEIDKLGSKPLFSNKLTSEVTVLGGNTSHQISSHFETFLLQVRNESNIEMKNKCIQLVAGNTFLIPKHMSCTLKSLLGSYTLAVRMPSMPSDSQK